MVTLMLVVLAVLVVLALVGVGCQIFGGGFFAIFHLMNDSVGKLFELLAELVGEILKGLNS